MIRTRQVEQRARPPHRWAIGTPASIAASRRFAPSANGIDSSSGQTKISDIQRAYQHGPRPTLFTSTGLTLRSGIEASGVGISPVDLEAGLIVLVSKPLEPLLQRTGGFIARVSLLQLHRQNVDGSFKLVLPFDQLCPTWAPPLLVPHRSQIVESPAVKRCSRQGFEMSSGEKADRPVPKRGSCDLGPLLAGRFGSLIEAGVVCSFGLL